MTMIKCPECRHHISSLAKACPECGAPIDPEWAQQEAERELKKLEEVPFTVEGLTVEDEAPLSPEENPEEFASAPLAEEQGESIPEENVSAPLADREGVGGSPSGVSPVGVSPTGTSHASRWLIAVVILLLLLIGGLYFYDYRAEQQREERAYELLQGCSNPDFYEDFIVRFPKSKRIEEVRARYEEAKNQQSQWLVLVASGSRDDLQRFVHEHPTSPYIKVAQSRIDSLDWVEAKQARTIDALSRYIANHPEGYYVDQADMLRSSLERAKAEAEAAAAALRDSLAQAEGQAE